eukprot:CAMPEP_0198725174 /NCGR_PEP_ID=MMETSP1475-20131203/2534_1 /TAXON_ID= ORGANISM="Unidentified sp., Strain CCMP1999" /NCGR_SAMPLE_ID=MMETSP1475 /ASSEMBLY_ACC=CAM_ASM_001111 /LENGTH=67 /DNA_ID=CAMNT_0044486901 /DNA_START=333 /DNA_END=533 /DNA_ORIENTATION=-
MPVIFTVGLYFGSALRRIAPIRVGRPILPNPVPFQKQNEDYAFQASSSLGSSTSPPPPPPPSAPLLL